MIAVVRRDCRATTRSPALVIVLWPYPSLKRTPQAGGFATVPGSRLA